MFLMAHGDHGIVAQTHVMESVQEAAIVQMADVEEQNVMKIRKHKQTQTDALLSTVSIFRNHDIYVNRSALVLHPVSYFYRGCLLW